MEDRGTDTTCSLFLFTAINTFFSGLGKKKKEPVCLKLYIFFFFILFSIASPSPVLRKNTQSVLYQW